MNPNELSRAPFTSAHGVAAPRVAALVAVAVALIASACASGGIGSSDPFARGGEVAEESRSSTRLAARPSIDLAGSVTGGAEGGVVPDASITGAAGTFEFSSLAAGTYTLTASAPGFRSLEQRIEVQGLPPVRLEIHLQAEGDEEGPGSAAIRARQDPLQTVGFYDRRERESGSFLVSSDIRRLGGRSPADLVLSLVGFRALPQSGIVVGRRGCPPTLFIDGADVGDLRQINFLVSVSNIAALEAYPGSSPPAIFAGVNSQCGAVVIWTPRGGS
jgi:hypothetical protein